MKEKCLIISRKFHGGHWSHISAMYSLFNDLGYDTYLYVNEQFLNNEEEFVVKSRKKLNLSDYREFKLVVVLFPDFANSWNLIKFKFWGTAKLIYLFHEPIDNYSSFRLSGFSRKQIVRLFFINQFNKLTSLISTYILLPSNKSFITYRRSYEYLNNRYFLIPLLFDDEGKLCSVNSADRKFISYIGTIASDHAFEKFCTFVIYAIKNKLFQDKIFLIATSNTLDPLIKKELLISGSIVNLKIVDGAWLSNKEINYYFSKSAIVWNAYDRSNQSGVLAKSFMFGAPILGNKMIPNEFIIHKSNGIYLDNNTDLEEISAAVFDILKDLDSYSTNSRETFMNNYFYKKYISFFELILN